MLARRSALVVLALTALLTGATSAAQADPAFTSYPVTLPSSIGRPVVDDGAGGVWFAANDTANLQPRIAHFDPAHTGDSDGGVKLYPTPTFTGAGCCSTQIRSMVLDATRHLLWFTRSDGVYGYLNTEAAVPGSDASGFSIQHPSPSPGELHGLSLDPATGRVWFSENSSSNVASPSASNNYPGNRIATTDGGLGLAEYPNLMNQHGEVGTNGRYDAKLDGTAFDGSNGVWVVEADTGNPGRRIAHATGSAYEEYPIPACATCTAANSAAGGSVALAKDGTVWFTVAAINNGFFRFDPSSHTVSTFRLTDASASLTGGSPFDLRADEAGNLWLAELGSYGQPAANALVKIVPGAQPAVTVYPTGSASPYSVAPTATGGVWTAMTNQATNKGAIGLLGDAGTAAPTPTSTPGPLTSDPGPSPTPAPSTSPAPVVLAPVGVAKVNRTTVSTDTVAVRQICVGPPSDPCSLVYELDAHDYVRGFPGTKQSLSASAASATIKPKQKTKKPVVLGSTTVTMHGGETKTVKVRLGKKARAALLAQSIKATLVISQKQPDGTLKVLSKKSITFKKLKRKK